MPENGVQIYWDLDPWMCGIVRHGSPANTGPTAIFGHLPMAFLLRVPLFLLAVCVVDLATGQDRILMMNGEIHEGKVLGQSTLEVRYLQKTRSGRLKERAEPTEEVFSVIDSLGKERVWYFHDTVFGNDLTVDQMRWFLNGERDARNGYKPTWPMIGAFATGAGLVIGLNWEMNGLFIPPIVAGAMALPRVHVTPGSISDPVMEGDMYYATGYARVARSKRVIRTLVSAFAGVAVGLAVRQLIINPNLDTE